jgi:hypothetical protein
MIRQTCQKCGFPFGPPKHVPPDTVQEERDEELVGISIGAWHRDYYLCECCAVSLRDLIILEFLRKENEHA